MGSNRSIPPTKEAGNAIGELMVSIINKLINYDMIIVSRWHSSLKNLDFDRSKYHHIIPTLSDKLYKIILKIIPYRIKKYIFGYTSINRIIYYRGINTLLKKIKPDIIISHVHFHLFKSIKIAIPNAKHIFYFHSSDLGDWPKDQIQFLYNNADGIISICNHAFLDVIEKHALNHINPKVIYNGIDTNKFSVHKRQDIRNKMRNQYNFNNNDIVVLYAGRIHESKGLDSIVEAFLECYKSNSNLKLFIVGGGYSKYDNQLLQKILLEKSKEFNGEIIKVIRWIHHDNMINIYSLADISILASLVAEGNSLFIMESMACGIPVICTNVGGLTEIVNDNETGILVNKDNLSVELPKAIKRLVDDENMRSRIGENASAHINQNFNINIMIRKLDKYLQNFI